MAQGVRVAVIGSDGTLHYKPIQIGRDYGDQVEVLGGLDPADVIATALPSGVRRWRQGQERPAGERQRRIVMMKMTASSRIMTAMKKPEKVRKPDTLALTPPMSRLQLVELLAQARRLDVEALHLVAQLLDLFLARGVGVLQAR